MVGRDVGGADRRRGFRVDRGCERLHFVHTEHVNWVVYAGPDGLTLIDSGYVGQRDLLVASLDAIGRRPEEVAAVLRRGGRRDGVEIGEQPGQALGQHRLARPGRSDHQQVVTARGRDLERAAGHGVAVTS